MRTGVCRQMVVLLCGLAAACSAGVPDSLLNARCDDSRQILRHPTKRAYYAVADSAYAYFQVRQRLRENQASAPFMRKRSALLAVGATMLGAGATLIVVNLAQDNPSALSPLCLSGYGVMFAGLGLSLASTKQVTFAISAYNKSICGK